MSVKKEIKEEEFDDFLYGYLLANQTVDEKLELEQNFKTEMMSPTIPDQEFLIPTDIKEEEEEEVGLGEYGQDDSSATSESSWYKSPKIISLQSPPRVYMF